MVKQMQPKIVVLGGGTGMPVLLQGLKTYDIDLTTIVAVADDGGSTGKIREKIDTPAPGDIRNVIAALANVDEDLNQLFQHRIASDSTSLSGHALGNVFLVAMSSLTGNFYDAVKKVSEIFKVDANIIPIVNESITLHAEMTDGTIVSGESNIPVKNKKIKRVFHTPEHLTPVPNVVDALLEADLIVISPGSLYTSILPNLIFTDVVNALNETKAKVTYVSNLMTQEGETNHYSVADHIKAIYEHIGDRTIDYVIVHDKVIEPAILAKYKLEQSSQVHYDKNRLHELGVHVIEADILDYSQDVVRHNNTVLAKIIYDLALVKFN